MTSPPNREENRTVAPELIDPLLEALEERGLARESKDGRSLRIHATLGGLLLTTLGQLLRGPAETLGFALQPLGVIGEFAAESDLEGRLLRLLNRPAMPTAGRIVISDLNQVGFDLAEVPLDEVLAFRAEHGAAYRAYARDLRAFLRSLATADPASYDTAYIDRREALSDAAADLARHARRAWRRPMASFALGIAGSAVALTTGNPAAAGLAFASGLLGLKRQADPASAYTYLLYAQQAWPPHA